MLKIKANMGKAVYVATTLIGLLLIKIYLL